MHNPAAAVQTQTDDFDESLLLDLNAGEAGLGSCESRDGDKGKGRTGELGRLGKRRAQTTCSVEVCW